MKVLEVSARLFRSAQQALRASIALSIVLPASDALGQFSDIGITIEESGEVGASNWEVIISPRRLYDGDFLAGPNGLLLTELSDTWDDSSSSWRIAAESPEEIKTALEGGWSLTSFSPFTFSPSREVPTVYEFRLEEIPLDLMRREIPSSFSLTEGQVVESGNEFLLTWAYPSPQLSPTLLEFSPLFGGRPSGVISSQVSPPIPNGSYRRTSSIGVADRSFQVASRNVPGASTQQWFYTLTADEASLPLDVQVTIGTSSSLNTSVWTRGTASPFDPFRVTLNYLGLADRFTFQLSTVPEPSCAVLLMVAAAISGGLRVRRGD